MKSTLVVLLATVVLAAVLGPRALEVIQTPARAEAARDAKGAAATDRARRDRKAGREDEDDDDD